MGSAPSNGSRPAPQKRTSGAQPGNSNALKHGAYRKRTALKSIDWTTQLDRRTRLYAELRERASRIVDAAGGAAVIGANRAALAPHAAQVELELECLNQAIREQGPIDRRRNKARAIVEDRNRLLRTYRELLDVIGLERAEPPGETLHDVLAGYRRGDPLGTPRLAARGRSVPHEKRRDSENPFPADDEDGADRTDATPGARPDGDPGQGVDETDAIAAGDADAQHPEEPTP